jgi:hypothetical protein
MTRLAGSVVFTLGGRASGGGVAGVAIVSASLAAARAA